MSKFYHLDDVPVPYRAVSASSIAMEHAVWDSLEPLPFDGDLGVGLIGCGWVAGLQLDAYRRAGIRVHALCDRHRERAERYRDLYYPQAKVFDDIDEFLAESDVAVVDIATHVDVRPSLVEKALRAGKHVLSQKPFVEDLDVGSRLAALADEVGRVLAVNQNGRWAPHFGAMLALVRSGLIGSVTSADFLVAWPQDLVVEAMPAFATMQDLILYDFGSHWFDVVGLLAPQGELSVWATTGRRAGQVIPAPTQANAVISGDDFMASLTFRAAERFEEVSRYRVVGTDGVVTHTGKHLGGDTVVVSTRSGQACIDISNNWFRHGMTGSMRSILNAITNGTQPSNSPESALRGLSLCFAATGSAETGNVQRAGSRRTRSGTEAAVPDLAG